MARLEYRYTTMMDRKGNFYRPRKDNHMLNDNKFSNLHIFYYVFIAAVQGFLLIMIL
jgi:hypothetical protein